MIDPTCLSLPARPLQRFLASSKFLVMVQSAGALEMGNLGRRAGSGIHVSAEPSVCLLQRVGLIGSLGGYSGSRQGLPGLGID